MTLTDSPAIDPTATPPTDSPAAPAVTSGNTYSVIGLVLSVLSIPLALGPLAIAGVVLGFFGRSKEPAARTTANWAIVVGLLSLFGWALLAVLGLVLFAPFALAAVWTGVTWPVIGF